MSDPDLPPELRHADPGDTEGSTLPAWVRVTALVLVVAVALAYGLSWVF